MKKLLLIWSFFTLFFIFYKKSRKFRLSLIAALAAFNFLMPPPQARASETNAFPQPQTQHRVRDSSSSGLFGRQSKSGLECIIAR